jgi:ketosteroid isomerase-like protein
MQRRIILTLVSMLTGAAIAWLAATHHAVASSVDERAAIAALNRSITDAIQRRDVDAVMAGYVDDPDITFFEDTTPFELRGRRSIRRYIEELVAGGSGIQDRLESPAILVSGALATAHYTLIVNWTDKSGTHAERGRYTQILMKTNGKWRIWHEHFSVPYDPATGKAVLG